MFFSNITRGSLISICGFSSKEVADLLALSAASRGWRCLLLTSEVVELEIKNMKKCLGELIILECTRKKELLQALTQGVVRCLDLLILDSLENYFETTHLTAKEARSISSLLKRLRVLADSSNVAVIVACNAKSKKLKLILRWWSKATIELQDLGIKNHVLAIIRGKGKRKMFELKLGRKLKRVGFFSLT